MSLKSQLEAGKFVVTAEVGPLKGTDTTEIEEVAEFLRGRVDATNVTDQQSSVMRLGSLATCHLLKERGLDPVFQVTCRDRNRLALQSDLLSAYVLGVENVLAITGDLPSLGDHPQSKPGMRIELRLGLLLSYSLSRWRKRLPPGLGSFRPRLSMMLIPWLNL